MTKTTKTRTRAVAKTQSRARSGAAQAVPTTMLQLLQAAVTSPDVSVEKMRDLFELSRSVELDNDKREFHARMAQLQAEIAPIAADAANPQTHSKYASYVALDRALRPHYTRHGFSVRFDSEPSAKGEMYTRVLCIVSYGAYEQISGVDMPISTKGAKGGDVMTLIHASQSTISYGRRSALGMAFNLAVEKDDDGNAATIRTVTASQIAQLVEESEGRDTSALFTAKGITDWSELPQAEFNKTMAWMKAKKETTREQAS